MKRGWGIPATAWLVLAMIAIRPAFAQMVTGRDIPGYRDVFGLQAGQRPQRLEGELPDLPQRLADALGQ